MNKLLLILFFLGVGIFLLITYLRQRDLIYYPARQTPQLHFYNAQDMESVTIVTSDQLKLTSWYIKAKEGKPTVLYLHGNAGHIGFRVPMARKFIESGFGVLLLEYRGYGGNLGSPSEKGLYTDARAGLKFLLNLGINPQRIVLYGESLGSGVATKLASENPVCAVVLQSPYTSMSDLARYHYPWLWLKPWDKYDSLSRIDAIHSPLLILHGNQDRLVPYSQGEALFTKAQEPKKMISLSHAGHNNLWGNEEFSVPIIQFIQQYCASVQIY